MFGQNQRGVATEGHPHKDVMLFVGAATDGREGLTFLGKIMDQDPDAAVVIITAHGAVSVAVEAIKRGASDFVTPPASKAPGGGPGAAGARRPFAGARAG